MSNCSAGGGLSTLTVPLTETHPYLSCSKNRAVADIPIFNCISMLAKAVGPTLSPHMSELLDLMLMTGLSAEMCQSLAVLSVQIPDLLAGVQGIK